MKSNKLTTQFYHQDAMRRRYSPLLSLSLVVLCLLLVGWDISFAQSGEVPSGMSQSMPQLVPTANAASDEIAQPTGIEAPSAATAEPNFSLIWSSVESDLTHSVAWGDYDSDGDLDLAGSRLYRNDRGMLTASAAWTSKEAERGESGIEVWGDYDGDGDLDLAVGYQGPNRLYRNDGGVLTSSAVWTSTESDATYSVAWGDYDGDGDLDLAVGNREQPNRLYRNNGGVLSSSAVWSSVEADHTFSIAWGDYDGDGDLDLAAGNAGPTSVGQPNRLYRNDGGVLTPSAVWSSSESDYTTSIAWGDYDGDSDLDLVAGNYKQPNRIYRNDGGSLKTTATWSSADADATTSVAWGDYDGDGDPDLVVGNNWESNKLYRNDGGVLTSSAVWSSPETDRTWSVAWGDYDGDGDLDLAVGNEDQPNRLYRNNREALALSAIWSSTEADRTGSVAWGDYDGDGDLDLAVGNYGAYNRGQANRLYRNDAGTLTSSTVWSSVEVDQTYSLAWGDYDSDGDLDLAVGNTCGYGSSSDCRSVRLYRNNGSGLTTSAVWSSVETDRANSVAWGDYDSDGDLDLAVGNLGAVYDLPNRLYRNDGGTLTPSAVWSSAKADYTTSVAWGDYDGDGDLDLAIANDWPNRLYRNDAGALTPNTIWASTDDGSNSIAWGDYDGDGDLDLAGNHRLYRNDEGALTPSAAWFSIEADDASSVVWGDYDGDGDLDLAIGNYGQPNRLYRNDRGTLTSNAVWSSAEADNTKSIAWGDYDGDGDLDLVVGNDGQPNRLYRNTRDGRSLRGAVPTIRVARPGANADFFSASAIRSGLIPITYTLAHPQSAPVKAIRAWYSPDGGGQWLPAVPASGVITTNLSTTNNGTNYTFTWDVAASGFFGQSDNVVFRIEAIPAVVTGIRNAMPGPYLYGAYASQTFPFRVRGTQVRVLDGAGKPVPNALVYRLPAGQERGAELMGSATASYRTDPQGYLQGRGQLAIGDRLAALAPVQTKNGYTLYHTSAAPTEGGLNLFTVSQPGVQTLTVSPNRKFILFDLDVALEWDARKDARFMAQLDFDLKRTSELLFDWTDGQVALGKVRVFHGARRVPEANGFQPWYDAHIRIHTTNRLRPWAAQGGIVSEALTDPQQSDIIYEPGQVHMGAVWNRYGEAGGSLGEDWPRTLAHELGHYLLYLDDNYMGLDANGVLIPIDTCPGAMADPYRDDYSEFDPDAGWTPACASTLSNLETGRSDWATIGRFYDGLTMPAAFGSQPGPRSLPLAVTQIQVIDSATAPATLDVPIFYLADANDASTQAGNNARAFLLQDDWLTDLGRPTVGEVRARGARPGDRLCVFEPERDRQGCETITAGDDLLRLASVPDWQPEIVVSPVTSTTITVRVGNVPAGLTLSAQLYPAEAPAAPGISLSPTIGGYEGTFHLSEPALDGYVHVYSSAGREAITDYTIGGNPGHVRSGAGHVRSGAGHVRSGAAPAMSSDGQVIIFGRDLTFALGEFYVVQAATRLPDPPAWTKVIGQGYWLTASAHAPSLQNTSISFQYLGSQVSPGEESFIRIYFWNGAQWLRLDDTNLNTNYNIASTRTRGPGLYALMSSIEIPLYGPGWNLFAYSVLGQRPPAEALASIRGHYHIVYGYDGNTDKWEVYDPVAPAWVNDLQNLRFGRGYWLNATDDIILLLKGASASSASSTNGIGLPPATYYGKVVAAAGFAPATGMAVRAMIGGIICGEGEVMEIESDLVYVIKVLADGFGTSAGTRDRCGSQGRQVSYEVDGQSMNATGAWNNEQAHELNLAPKSATRNLYLPLITR